MYLIILTIVWLSFCYLITRRRSYGSPYFNRQDELSERSLLAAKKDELDVASNLWKCRVEKSDAEKFSVAGKMGEKMGEKISQAVPTIRVDDEGGKMGEKRRPKVKRFKSKDGTESTPLSPEKGDIFDLSRSKSVPDFSDSETQNVSSARRVSILNPDDCTFRSFFKSVENGVARQLEVSREDFDAVKRESLLVIRKNVQVQNKRRGANKNPIKALAARTDIANEFTEVITGVAEREKKRLDIERLSKTIGNSNKAIEALAGLASKENFKAISLKKSSTSSTLSPWKDIMLLQVKGRRHVQTRLVEPCANSINEGDCYVLITPNALYNYIGKYSNVIEQSRAADIANHVQKTGDLNCKVVRVVTVEKDAISRDALEFWKVLGCDVRPRVIDAGHPNEDESYESNILQTNMIYTLEGEELVPSEKYWGAIPKIEILKETSIVVFDFGTEMYVWSGKNAKLERKKLALKLAKEMWEEGYNYSDCDVCPVTIASNLGTREQPMENLKKSDRRPDWALFSKITQHGETILFKEKFLDWPDFSRVIQVKRSESFKESSPSFEIDPYDVEGMLRVKSCKPDLVVEKTHLGRGDEYWDEETGRLFEYKTTQLKGWHILENSYEELQEKSLGHFYDGDSYIYRWDFKQTVKGKDLNGNPSRRAPVGRDRCVYFYWQGVGSSINEKGTAAFLTVELDKNSAPQVRIEQGAEPAAFLRLFGGDMVIHKGKREETSKTSPRLFIARGEIETEVYLMEVPLNSTSLRSRTSFVVINSQTSRVILWHGSKSTKQKRKVTKSTVERLAKNKPAELYLDDSENVKIDEIHEGNETQQFFDIFGTDSEKSYMSLLNVDGSFDYTLRLFSFSSITGSFEAIEKLCPHRSEHCSPYPFVQNELYSMNQPALYLLDNNHELWLWQGWWPEKDEDDDLELLSEQTGSGAVRWQMERRAAMRTAVDYWRKTREEDKPVEAYLVWAGLEPLEFRNLFPDWEVKEDVMELNMKEGKKPDMMLPLEKELALLSRTEYPLADLLQRPLPEGVDPTNIEKYLSGEDFKEVLEMSKEKFDRLPSWKKTALKKEKGLF